MPERSDDELFDGSAYRCVRRLADRGLDRVFLVEHRLLGVQRLVKVFGAEPAGDEAGERFRRDARSLARLEHPNVEALDGAGTTSDGRPFLVFEHLAGETLAQRLEGGRLPAEAAFALGRDVLEALATAHALGIAHGHLALGNVSLVRAPFGQQRALILDFGLAQASPGDAAEDVFAAAVVLLACLLGEGTDLSSRRGATAGLRDLRRGSLSGFLPVFEKALAARSSERFQSADELLNALAAATRTAATPGEAAARSGLGVTRLLAAFLLAVTLGASLALWLRGV